MAKVVNRAAQLWQNWSEQQQVLEGILGKALRPRDLDRQQYDFLKAGLHRLSAHPSPDERLLLNLLQRHTDRLEKELYPNPIIRVLVRFKALVFDRPLIVARQRKLEDRNRAELAVSLKEKGFNGFETDLGRQLDFERPRVEIALTAQLNDQLRYETLLHLEKNGLGTYQLAGFTGTIKDPAVPEQARSYLFSADSGMTAKEAVNLLQGRAVRKNEQWLQLDLDNRGANGYALRVFEPDYGFELRKELVILGVHLGQPGLTASPLLKALEEGKQVSVNVAGADHLVEADPGRRTLTIRDGTGAVVPLETLVKKLPQPENKLEPGKSKAIIIKKEKQTDRSLSIS